MEQAILVLIGMSIGTLCAITLMWLSFELNAEWIYPVGSIIGIIISAFIVFN